VDVAGSGGALAVAVIAGADRARAAGSAYQVDTGTISEPGHGKVDAWVSSASSKDFFAAMAPSCVVDLGRPFELSAQFSRFRSGEEWTTAVQPNQDQHCAGRRGRRMERRSRADRRR
jgi:hypothetical protein